MHHIIIDCILLWYYSHTFENKSSLAPKPPPEGLVAGGLEAAGVTGAALFHPPKSSSAAIFGGSLKLFPPPKFDVVAELPQDEKSLVIVATAGDLLSGFVFVLAAGSGLAQALFEPQGSSLAKPEKVLELAGASEADLAAGWEGGAGADRLNAELRLMEGAAGLEGMADRDGKGSEKSNRLLEALFVDGFVVGVVVLAKSKSPRLFDALDVRSDSDVWAGGFEAVAGCDVLFGALSKKLPPLSCGAGFTGGDM